MAQRFKDELLGFAGGIEAAYGLMDTSGTGKLSKEEFVMAYELFNHSCGTPLDKQVDASRVYRELDLYDEGHIDLEDVLTTESKQPRAAFWRRYNDFIAILAS